MKTRDRTISGWPDANAEPAWLEDDLVHPVGRRFEQVVSADPGAVAFAAPDGLEISYGDLNSASNRLGRLIQRDLEDSTDVVGLLVRDPAVAITGMLGALKAGRLYTPLDPSDPPSRLEHIVTNAGARLIATAPEHVELARRLTGGDDAMVVIGRDDRSMPNTNFDSGRTTADPAYMLYTSGSTGAPKGVVHSHRYLLHKGEVQRTIFGMGRGDRVSLLFGPATGAANSGIFGPLLNGGTVCPYDLTIHGLHNMGRWISDREISTLHLVPTIFRRFLAFADEEERYPTMRLVILSGEPTFRRDVELYQRHFGPDTVLAPRLSSAETSVVSVDFLDVDSEIEDDILTVGFPLDEKVVRLIDDSGQEVPVGSVGQIEVESEHLALGYWRNPELTELKFGTSGAGRRTYRMGDLGRFREDGRLEFLGRVDDRLKIGGVTIEPREVERAMQRVGRFKELAVIGVPGAVGVERLVAYAVLDDGEEGLPPNFRASLAELLPAPMIPTTTVIVDALPLTSLGKVDRRSLPPLEVKRADTVPARDDLEAQLVGIWSEVLDLDDVGVTDDFFELGGTSIQALHAFAVIGRRLRIDVPSTTLLQAPTIASLADVIRSGAWAPTQNSLVPVLESGTGTPFFCVHGGGGGVFFVRDLAAHLGGNRPIYGLQARGFEGHPGPYRQVEELAANYLQEVRSVQAYGPYLLGGLSFGGKVAFEMARQLISSGETVALVAMLDTKANATPRRPDPGRHRTRMAAMKPADRVLYMARGITKRAVRTGKRGLIRYYLSRGRPLPDTLGLRNLYFYPMHSRANRAYQPTNYSGRVAMIASSGQSQIHEDTWGRISEGGFSVVEVPADHLDMTDPPYVTDVCRHLQYLLDDADPRVALVEATD